MPPTQSQTINLYWRWTETASEEDIGFVDAIYDEAEEHYDEGGDTIVECFTPVEVLETFKGKPISVRAFCQGHLEKALNARWGEDDDPQAVAYQHSGERMTLKTDIKTQEQKCSICGQDCGKPKIGAKVTHMACLMAATAHMRS